MDLIRDVGLVHTTSGDDGASKDAFELLECAGWSCGCQGHERDASERRCQPLQVSVGRSIEYKSSEII